MKEFLLSIISIVLFYNDCSCQLADNYSFKIDSLIQSNSPRIFNGIILILKNNKIKYSKVHGYADIEKKCSLTLHDNFRIMSNSKQITAVLILKEVENGLINLQIPIRKYLPDLTQSWADTITVHQLLNFSSGITEIDKPLAFKPGTDFLYGVSAYTLLGRILEKVTGSTFIQLANDLFKKLKLKNTFCYEEFKSQNSVINGYVYKNNILVLREHPIQGNGWIDFIPAGGIISNSKDLSLWDTKLHKGKILNTKSYQLMTNYNITAQHEAFGSEKLGYGYGLRISDKYPVIYYGHAGKGLGFVSLKIYFPSHDVNLIILENVYHDDNQICYYFESKIREIVINSNLIK